MARPLFYGYPTQQFKPFETPAKMFSRRYDYFDDATRWDRLMPDEGSYLCMMERRFKMQQRRRLEDLARGNRRREVELEKLGRFTPSGIWDADCDAHPEQIYRWDMGAGFKGMIMRNISHWTWCVYVDLPEWYPHRAEPCAFWNGETAAAEILDIKPPRWARESPASEAGGETSARLWRVEFTYGGSEDFLGKADVPGRYGIDHSWDRDRAPLAKAGQAGSFAGCYYTTYEKAVEESWLLAAHFLDMITDGTLVVTPEILEANKEGFLRIREQEMRICAARRVERQRRKAAEAEAARKKAEEEAAAAAAAKKAEEERLAAARAWEADAPKRRIRNILKTLREIDALELMSVLTEDQQKKVARRAELEKEKAELEAKLL